MERYRVKSEALRGKNAKRTMQQIAYAITKELGPEVAGDVLRSMVTTLDGGPEQWGDPEKLITDISEIYRTNRDQFFRNVLALNIEGYVQETTGYFGYDQVDREFGIKTQELKVYRRKIFQRLVEKGIIERHPTRNGYFQRVIDTAEKLDWMDADINDYLDLHWPFGLENYVRIYPKSIVVVAGDKSSGKTALLLNFMKMNMDNFSIKYFTSEMGKQLLKVRLSKFDIPINEWSKVDIRLRTSQFPQIIDPNAINVIDFYEISDSFFLIGNDFRKIFERLDRGIAVIAIQKAAGAELGRGAGFSLEKAALYLTIDHNRLKIYDAKTWATDENPRGKEFSFALEKGCVFTKLYTPGKRTAQEEFENEPPEPPF